MYVCHTREDLEGVALYLGHYINLYNRISSYFMPSILATKNRRVLRHFNKHGFGEVNLTVYVLDDKTVLDEVVRLEQHMIDTLAPTLNVNLVASGSGYHGIMSEEMREKLLAYARQRGTTVFMYDKDLILLYIFYSKQQMYNSISIHHSYLDNCLYSGVLYLDNFLFSLDIIEQSIKTKLLTLQEVKELVTEKRNTHVVKYPSSRSVLAEYKEDPTKN